MPSFGAAKTARPSTSPLDVQERFRVSASALRLRRVLGVAGGPFVGALLLLRVYMGGALGNVSPLFWLGLVVVTIFATGAFTYGAKGWIRWASNHCLEITNDGLSLVDGQERELRSFADIARLDVRRTFGRITRVRLTYAGQLKQDLSFYERISDLVALLKAHISPEKVHE